VVLLSHISALQEGGFADTADFLLTTSTRQTRRLCP
jgi:hypothetical protein